MSMKFKSFRRLTEGNLNVLIKILKLKFSLFFVAESHS